MVPLFLELVLASLPHLPVNGSTKSEMQTNHMKPFGSRGVKSPEVYQEDPDLTPF